MRIQLQQAANFSVTLDACEGIQNVLFLKFLAKFCFQSCLVPILALWKILISRLTLGVIMGTFLICWLPFFIVNVIRSFLPALISDMQFKAVTWLGYANSTANPIIYTILNRDFRIAFKKILFDDVLCSSRDVCLNGNCGQDHQRQ
ncbi:unnamed protein product [Brugia timori]|uniref:G_PROTEIN_RECEP_F1_2 domain-containing protein n=1 Tax=Brugia timori TaxID=42155 RepID=A0A0R3Q674_9BILA|nr:unnamed protein product [Brugia timori]